jgi:hypothetical protein
MSTFVHAPGDFYRIMDGVRRSKAAWMSGHALVRAEVVDASGQSLGAGEVPIDALRSPKALIRRITSADETRWRRAQAGAGHAVLPFPPITIQPSEDTGTKIEDVEFDYGGVP